MKQTSLFLIALFSVLWTHAQFNYDKNKIEKIRWTPNPGKVNGLEKNVLDLNGKWDFSVHPEKDFFKTEAHKEWSEIDVPGEWVMQGFEVEPATAAGYSHNFQIENKWEGYRIKLKCEAIYSECRIWINGNEVGSHMGGFTPFEFDVTEFVNSGDNHIAISVKSESLADTLSSGSQYAVHPLGGISRPIYLLAIPKVNLASLHVSTTFEADYINAKLNIEAIIANETKHAQGCRIEYTLIDPDGKPVPVNGEQKTGIEIEKGSLQKLSTSLSVVNPLKWDSEHPNLYKLYAKIFLDGKEASTTVRRFGFREIEVRGNQVYVNNMPVKLHGVCRHEVDPSRGRSLTGNQWYEDVKIFKEGNVNYIRTSHYPPNEKLLEACDELGMFVEVEAPFCWANKARITDDNYFESILQPTLEMVERDKSHPSVLLWSLGNESSDFDVLFKESGRLVKEADPSRPRIFSQWSPDGDNNQLEIGNHHYPGSGGPHKYKDSKRPMVFDEYLHLNAYNRYELMTDPGVRDFWGDLLFSMWEDMYYAKGVLGGALWAGIDDSFFLPDGHVVGYGTWGPIDGWRRPKPEYWHMKKVYSPVKIELIDGEKDSLVTLEIENRYLFSNLNECKIKWKNNDREGVIAPSVAPYEKQKVTLPFTNNELGTFSINVWKDGNVPVDQYFFDFKPAELIYNNTSDEVFSWKESKSGLNAESKKIKVSISPEELTISTSEGNIIIEGWPVLMLVPLNNGGDTQMTKETPDYSLYSPAAGNRSILSLEIEKNDSFIRIILKDSYTEAVGKEVIEIYADGHIELAYNYKMLKNMNPRQWGISMSHPGEMENLSWKRKGLWSVYSHDHISRLEGTAKSFYSSDICGLAGPAKQPSWPYKNDQTKYGSNDFRSTKRNILTAQLFYNEGPGLKVISDGSQNVRAWIENGVTKSLISDYNNPGAERFLRGFANHAAKFDQPLKQDQIISGKITMQIIN